MPDLEARLRTLLARDADDVDPESTGRVARRLHGSRSTGVTRGRSIVALVAVAAAIGAIAVTTATVRGHRAPTPAATPPAAIADLTDLADPAPGFRWVSWRTVAVQVPTDWAYGHEPTESCAAGTVEPASPYVAVDPVGSGYTSTLMACSRPPGLISVPGFGVLDPRAWTPHLAWRDPTAYVPPDQQAVDGDLTHDGWTLSTRTVAGSQLQLLTAPGQDALREEILASATGYQTDQSGCAPVTPTMDGRFAAPATPFDITRVDQVDSISICLYTGGGLAASRLSSGDEADDLFDALRSAPEQPEAKPGAYCLDEPYRDPRSLVLRLRTGSGVHDLTLFLSQDTCNGFTDGTHTYALTGASCRPLFARDPIRLGGATHAVFEPCATR